MTSTHEKHQGSTDGEQPNHRSGFPWTSQRSRRQFPECSACPALSVMAAAARSEMLTPRRNHPWRASSSGIRRRRGHYSCCSSRTWCSWTGTAGTRAAAGSAAPPPSTADPGSAAAIAAAYVFNTDRGGVAKTASARVSRDDSFVVSKPKKAFYLDGIGAGPAVSAIPQIVDSSLRSVSALNSTGGGGVGGQEGEKLSLCKDGGGDFSPFPPPVIGSRGSRKRGRRPQFVDRGLMVVALSDTTAGQTTGKKMEEIREFRGFKSDDGGEISSRLSPESKSPSVDFNFDLDLAHPTAALPVGSPTDSALYTLHSFKSIELHDWFPCFGS
ncbi:hypothetical protein ACFX10_028776 [Malus domestica]